MGSQVTHDVIVLGAGISGLACAHQLKEKAPLLRVLVIDSASRIGGTIQTTKRDGFIIERGPDSWVSEKKEAIELIQKLGLEDKLISTADTNRRSFILRNGRLRAVPEGFHMIAPSNIGAFLISDIMRLSGKMRMLLELMIPAKRNTLDESIQSFIERRLGREAYDYIAQPMVGGVYTGDPAQLSANILLQRFVDMEHKHGSLIRAMLKNKHKETTHKDSGPRYSLFMSLNEGMQTLVDALGTSISKDAIKLDSKIESIHYQAKRPYWQISMAGQSLKANALVMAIPPYVSADLLDDVSSEIAHKLRSIRYESVLTLNMAFKRAQIKHKLNGFGFVVPSKEKKPMIACGFSSIKFPNRAPYGHTLLRAFVGGPFGKTYFDMDQDELIWKIRQELKGIIGLEGKPLFIESGRYTNAMPQYVLGHDELVNEVESLSRSLNGLHLCGNAFKGVGIPDCIRGAQVVANKIIKENKS